jgi:hypothetical protein
MLLKIILSFDMIETLSPVNLLKNVLIPNFCIFRLWYPELRYSIFYNLDDKPFWFPLSRGRLQIRSKHS